MVLLLSKLGGSFYHATSYSIGTRSVSVEAGGVGVSCREVKRMAAGHGGLT